jgi:hypothetical protein
MQQAQQTSDYISAALLMRLRRIRQTASEHFAAVENASDDSITRKCKRTATNA